MPVRSRYAQTKPPIGSQVDWSHPLAQGMIFCTPMNEGQGQVIRDIAGNTKSVVASTATWANAPGRGPCMKFDGTDNATPKFGAGTGYPQHNVGTGSAVSIAAWMYMTVNASSTILARRAGGTFCYAMRANSATSVLVYTSGASGSSTNIGVPTMLNRWVNIVGVMGPRDTVLYLDGRLAGTAVGSKGGCAAGSVDMWIGGLGGGVELFTGYMGGVMAWQRELLAGDVRKLYDEPFAMLKPGMQIAPLGSGGPHQLISAGLVNRGLVNAGLAA